MNEGGSICSTANVTIAVIYRHQVCRSSTMTIIIIVTLRYIIADLIPTSIFKLIIDVIAPFVVALFNRSLAAGHFPAGFKEAFLTLIVKKPGSTSQTFVRIDRLIERVDAVVATVGAVVATRTPRCSPAEGLFNVR